MSSDAKTLIPVRIYNIYPYAELQQGLGATQTVLQGLGVPQNYLVFLKGQSNRVVPITIGHFEGQALVMAIRKMHIPRPLPHQLLQGLLDRMKARVNKLVIHTLREEVFHAYLLIHAPEETFCLDCRPSDGMILATLLGVPIFMSPAVMEEAGRVLDMGEGEEQAARLRAPRASGSDEDEDGDSFGETAVAVEDPDDALSEVDKLKAQLNRLIAEEAYEEAARVRDQISELEGD